ncbi:glycosyltransferase family 25 protein [Acinetobacter sp. VNH17]|uniref:Glycosyltransferase family 25 protein n=1 Tax=Acinetobacter thutiue TaxID=2998078 RepID=A0ABT7WSM5_9GAMM|nr:glycosyltransferase family 25 protein [Acinetobacter thutiue]MCY6413593.1 glycosyltransferase family 25 protein [Acinetobacter thutiue]MDN0015702.1 glycosyltransferase family 25 protein [Acinetobacter thutiue]
MQNCVISLKTETKRREHIQQEFNKQNIHFDFFDAITPEYNQEIAKKLKIHIENLLLTQGEISCLLSHISLWKKAIDENMDYIAIYEDDIHIGQQVAQFLNQSNWIPKDCDIIKLEAFYQHVFVSRSEQIRLKDDRALYVLKSKHVGAAGYILSQHAAKFLLEDVQNNFSLKPLDHIIFEDYIFNQELKVFQILPAICIQDDRKIDFDKNLYSALEIERRTRFKSQTKKQGFIFKIKKELLRVFLQLLKIKNTILYQRKKIGLR